MEKQLLPVQRIRLKVGNYHRQDSLRGNKSQQQSTNSSEHFPVAWRNLTGLKHVLYLSCFTSSSIRTNESDWQKIGQIK